jgi:5-methylthioribose kinase
MHAQTHSTQLGAERAAELGSVFENAVLRGIQLEYVFTKAFAETQVASAAAATRDDPAFMAEVEAIKSAYRGDDSDNRALCHGDLHSGSIMSANGNNRDDDDDCGVVVSQVKVIDPEFAVYAPPGLDVGSLLSGFVLAAIHHAHATDDNNNNGVRLKIDALKSGVQGIWSAYTAAMIEGGLSSDVVAQVAADALGFTGCEVMRTALGMAGVRGFKFDDDSVKAQAEGVAVSIGKRLVMARRAGAEHSSGIALILTEMSQLLL